MIENAYPLHWPAGVPRTKAPRRASFKHYKGLIEIPQAMERLRHELKNFSLVGSSKQVNLDTVVISCNVRGGLTLAKPANPGDSGVAVYFELDGERRCIPCDKWDRVADNIAGIAAAIGALRGLERWVNDANVRAAFKGFLALPDPNRVDWRAIFGVKGSALVTAEMIRQEYRRLAAARHPDRENGSEAAMCELNQARDQALAELSGGA